MLTLYGRKAVLEALQDQTLLCHTLHLAERNRPGGIMAQIEQAANARGLTVKTHSREALSRISKNARQDQGVALDIECPGFASVDAFLTALPEGASGRLLALDGISNPQNLGMIIRSAAAGDIDGIILAKKGNAALGPLVIKASAGTVYRAPLLSCDQLADALHLAKQHGAKVFTLDANASESLFTPRTASLAIYVLGNETDGVSERVNALADAQLSIPMRNGVESLNVAVTASLIAFAPALEDTHLDR